MFRGVHDSIQESRWYALSTQPHKESRAESNLKCQGFDVVHLRRRKTIKHARRFHTVMAPLFPGYLFVRLNLSSQRWRAINGSYGVRSLIMAGERPVPVPNGIVETLIDLHGPARLRLNSLKVGQRVRLVEGPFAEMIGELEQLDDAGRVRVLLELLGTKVPVHTTADGLVLA
jgi:transcription antitermination factor NusG